MIDVAASSHEHPAQHEKFALGEVYYAAGVIDDIITERHESIDAADSQSAQDILYDGIR
jgi:hypothetical protein